MAKDLRQSCPVMSDCLAHQGAEEGKNCIFFRIGFNDVNRVLDEAIAIERRARVSVTESGEVAGCSVG